MTTGYTVTPMIYVDESGQEHLNYEYANIEDHSINERIRAEHRHLQEQAIYVDENDELHSKWEDLTEEDDVSVEEVESDTSLIDFVEESIGYETYNNCLEWARDNLPDNEIVAFNRIIDSGDKDKAADVIVSLYKLYLEAN